MVAGAAMEETLSTLSYAARAKNIRNRPAVQVCSVQLGVKGSQHWCSVKCLASRKQSGARLCVNCVPVTPHVHCLGYPRMLQTKS